MLNRFYIAATQTLLRHDAVIDKLIGDEVMAFFVRGISGPQYRRRAVQAGMDLLTAVGYGRDEEPWLELGVAVNAGVAYVGNVGGPVMDFTALGDPVNVTARMQQHAAGGELLVASGVADRADGDNAAAHFEAAGARTTDRRLCPRNMRRLPQILGQATGCCRRTAVWMGRSASILMPSSSPVPLMAPTMIVVRCATNSSGAIRRGLSSLAPNHQSVADAAVPKIANAASSNAAGSSSMSSQLAAEHVGHRQGDVAALVDASHRGLGLLGEPALHQEAHHVGVLSTSSTYCSTPRPTISRAESLVDVDRRDDRRPQHVAHPLADRLEQV